MVYLITLRNICNSAGIQEGSSVFNEGTGVPHVQSPRCPRWLGVWLFLTLLDVLSDFVVGNRTAQLAQMVLFCLPFLSIVVGYVKCHSGISSACCPKSQNTAKQFLSVHRNMANLPDNYGDITTLCWREMNEKIKLQKTVI